MHFTTMDLIGTFEVSPQGHQYALTVIDMLMNSTWCMLLFTKEANEVLHAYLVSVYSTFSGSHMILSDSTTEFKSKLFTQVACTWGMK